MSNIRIGDVIQSKRDSKIIGKVTGIITFKEEEVIANTFFRVDTFVGAKLVHAADAKKIRS
jgi:hypothetical protein